MKKTAHLLESILTTVSLHTSFCLHCLDSDWKMTLKIVKRAYNHITVVNWDDGNKAGMLGGDHN